MLVLHIGTQKTGTAALQAYLAENADALLEQGIHYLKAGRVRSHGDLAQALKGKADIALWEEAREELQNSGSPTQVISAEGLWVSDPVALRNALPAGIPVRIVVYLRRQDKYLQSLWKQGVTGGRKGDFRTWLEATPYKGDYLATIEQWASVFGADSLVIRPYERPDGANTVADFCRIIGAVGLPPPENVRRNFSPRRELLHFMRALNNADVNMNHRNLFRAVIAKNSAYIRSSDMLSNEEAAELMARYAEGNRILAERYYHDSSTPLFPELTPSPPPEIWPLDSEEFFQLTVDVFEALIEQALAGKIYEGGKENGNRKKTRRAKRRAQRSGPAGTRDEAEAVEGVPAA